jgi:hypothetical protein
MRLEYFVIESDEVLDTVVLDEPPASDAEPIVYDTHAAEPVVTAIMTDVNLTEMAKRRQLAVWSNGVNAMRRI